MSYAQRPMGDYKTYGYAGDPGWLSSIWKGIKKVAPMIIGGMIGGPAGAIVAGAGAGGPKMTPQVPMRIPGTVGGAITFPGGTGIQLGYHGGQVIPGIKGGGTGGGRPGRFPASMGPIDQACPTGFHLDKRTGTRWVRNRRMNIANPRALRRAMRRVQGFEKMAKRTIQFTRRVKMKKRSSS